MQDIEEDLMHPLRIADEVTIDQSLWLADDGTAILDRAEYNSGAMTFRTIDASPPQ